MAGSRVHQQVAGGILEAKKLLDASRKIHQLGCATAVVTRTMEGSGLRATFKCENRQVIGSFKLRGAYNAVSCLTRPKAVITHSSGNHGIALSYAAQKCQVDAHVVMPRTASEFKKTKVIEYGGKITLCEPTLASREETAKRIIEETEADFIHPYNNRNVIYGQGTAAFELLGASGRIYGLDCILVPIGGGGLVSGTCLAVEAMGLVGAVKVIGCEPLGADDAYQSKEKGRLIPQENPQTIADGLRTSLGSYTWPVVRDQVEYVHRVTEEQIVENVHWANDMLQRKLEPSAVVGLAVLRSEEFVEYAKQNEIINVGVIFTGGNIDDDTFAKVLAGDVSDMY